MEERGMRIGSDGSADKEESGHLDDLYRLPPTDIQSIDEWKAENEDKSDTPDEPEPDYSDEENEQKKPEHKEQKEEDYVALRKALKPRLSSFLTHDDWDVILARADGAGSDVDIPEPDYDGFPNGSGRPLGRSHTVHGGSSPLKNNDGLVVPKKLLNPCLESKERKQLHREMMMNQKMGKDVLHQKSELKQEMERRQELQKKKELEDKYRMKRSSFECKLEEQANKLKNLEESQEKTIKEESSQPEFLRVHSKIVRVQQQ